MSERDIGGMRGGAPSRQSDRVEPRADAQRGGWSQLETLKGRGEVSKQWLQLMASMIQGVTQGLVLLREEQGEGFLPAAVWPEGVGKLDNLGRAAQKGLQAGQAVLIAGEEGEGGSRPRVAHPLMTDGNVWGVVVLEVESRSEDRLRTVMRGLQASSGWLRQLDPHRKAERIAKQAAQRLFPAGGSRQCCRCQVCPEFLLSTIRGVRVAAGHAPARRRGRLVGGHPRGPGTPPGRVELISNTSSTSPRPAGDGRRPVTAGL